MSPWPLVGEAGFVRYPVVAPVVSLGDIFYRPFFVRLGGSIRGVLCVLCGVCVVSLRVLGNGTRTLTLLRGATTRGFGDFRVMGNRRNGPCLGRVRGFYFGVSRDNRVDILTLDSDRMKMSTRGVGGTSLHVTGHYFLRGRTRCVLERSDSGHFFRV